MKPWSLGESSSRRVHTFIDVDHDVDNVFGSLSSTFVLQMLDHTISGA